MSLTPKAFWFGGLGKLSLLDYFVAIVDGKVVGTTGLYAFKSRPDEVWVGWYGVAAEFRGNGYGERIFQWTVDAARNQGFSGARLWTTSHPDYKAATIVYERHGFTVEDFAFRENWTTSHPDYEVAEIIASESGTSGIRFLVYSLNFSGGSALESQSDQNVN